jgi:hypothetical protein
MSTERLAWRGVPAEFILRHAMLASSCMSFFGGWLQGATLPPKRISGELRVKDAERKEAGSRMNANIMGAPTMTQTKQTPPARIEYLRVENYRALRTVELKSLTPLTALLGPNGSGNSTVFDVFAFLSECFESGLRRRGIAVAGRRN